MRLLGVIFFSISLTACISSTPNPVVQKLDLAILQMAAAGCQSVAVESAYKHTDIVKSPNVNDQSTTITLSAKYAEPFQGCARINSAYMYKKTGLFGSEKNHDFIFKVCEQDEDLYNVELIYPDVPGMTGVKDLIDVRRTAFYVKNEQ